MEKAAQYGVYSDRIVRQGSPDGCEEETQACLLTIRGYRSDIYIRDSQLCHFIRGGWWRGRY